MVERHFINPYPDFDPTSPAVIDEKSKTFVKSLIHKNINLIIDNENPQKHLKGRADLYVGLSGIAFMFLKLSASSIKNEFDGLRFAKLYSESANKELKSERSRKPISLLTGDAGVHIVSASVHNSNNEPVDNDIDKLMEGLTFFENPDYLNDGADEMLIGRCGYLLGILWLNRQLRREIIPLNEMKKMSSIIIRSGRNYANRFKLQIPLMFQFHGREYVGAAHGISAILLALLMVPLDEKDLADVKTTIDAILVLQDDLGNFPSKFNKPEAHLVHWCHGASGVVYLMAKAYKVFGNQKYLNSCLNCGELVWKRGLLRKGPGICHGVAGNGYVHLLLYRLTGDFKHLYRANKFAEFLDSESFKREARTPDRPMSLYEGLSGTVCFLIDLLQPEKAEFPFMNIFD